MVSPRDRPAVKNKSTREPRKSAGVATTVVDQLRASARRQSAPVTTFGTSTGTKARSRSSPAAAFANLLVEGEETMSSEYGQQRTPGSRRSAVATPRSHPRSNNSLRDPYQVPSDSEVDNFKPWSSTSKHSAARRPQQHGTPSVLTARHANNQEMPATPTLSSRAGGPGPTSARRSHPRTPSKVPPDARIISLDSSSSSNKTPSSLATAAHTPITPRPQTAKQVPEDVKVISLSDSSNNEAASALAGSPHGSATKENEEHPRQSPIHPSRRLGKKKANSSREPSGSSPVRIERKPWWNPWDWARKYGGTEFEVNGPNVWFSDGPFKGYIINGPREGGYMSGYQAPSDEALAQAEKTAVLAETNELWEISSEPSIDGSVEGQRKPTADTAENTEESSYSQLEPDPPSPAAIGNLWDNSENLIEQSPRSTERKERIQRTQHPKSNDALMLPANLAPASTPKRGSSLPSTNSESTSVLIARQLNVHSSPPPSNQELAVLMSSSPAPGPIEEEKSSDGDDDERGQRNADLGAGASADLLITPTRAAEVTCDVLGG